MYARVHLRFDLIKYYWKFIKIVLLISHNNGHFIMARYFAFSSSSVLIILFILLFLLHLKRSCAIFNIFYSQIQEVDVAKDNDHCELSSEPLINWRREMLLETISVVS